MGGINEYGIYAAGWQHLHDSICVIQSKLYKWIKILETSAQKLKNRNHTMMSTIEALVNNK